MDRLLKEIVAIPSVCGDFVAANKVLALAERELKELSLHINRFESQGFPSLVATTQKTKTPKVMLAAHLDVVDAPTELYNLRLEGGKYYGRGVLDMKSAAVAYINVLKEMRHILSQYDVGIMFTTDEEYFGNYGTGMLVKKGYIPEVCILPDSGFGTNWQIESFAKGVWFAHITSLGISAHGSRPWEGNSASIKLVQALRDVTELFKDAQKPDTATVNVGMLRAGNSINQIPAAAMASLDIRYNDLDNFLGLKCKIETICENYDVNLKTVREWNEPTVNDVSHPLVTAFTKHVALQTGVVPRPFSANGATDARFLAAKGVPCVLMSPPGGSAHSNDEWVSETGYRQFQLILRAYLDEVAKLPDSTQAVTEALTISE